MKKTAVDMEAILAPIAGEVPAGADLRYTPVYEQIKEARKEEDQLAQGDWQREVKLADWNAVVKVAGEALAEQTKDIQIAVWLTEGLIKREGFGGLANGLTILTSFLTDFWETLYPLVEDGDLEYRSGPLEFLNEKVALSIRDIPLTDEEASPGYAWHKWQESRQVGFEKDVKNQWGDVDDAKQRAREEKIAEGKLTGEEFDGAVAKSSREFYLGLNADIDACLAAFTRLDAVVDERFGRDAPRLSEIKLAIEDCQRVAAGILKDKGGAAPAPVAPQPERAPAKTKGKSAPAKPAQEVSMAAQPSPVEVRPVVITAADAQDQGGFEDAVWQDAQATLAAEGIKPALAKILGACVSAPAPRQANRYRLMMAKLALTAARPDLARPIVEELYALIAELGLERWESPLWIAEVIEAYYQCLTAEGAPDEDRNKADFELFPRLCSKDITKALSYKKGGQ